MNKPLADSSSFKSIFRCNGTWERVRMVLELILLFAIGLAAVLGQAELAENISGRNIFRLFSAFFLISWLFCLALIFLHPRLSGRICLLVNAVYTLLVPIYIYLTVEMITARPAKDDSLPVKLFGDTMRKPRYRTLNPLLITLVVILFILVTNSIRVGTELSATLLIVFAVVNIYVNDFRGLAVTASDFAVIGTALDVAGGYHFTLYPRIFQGLLNLLILITAAGRLSNTRLSKKWKTYGLNLAGVVLLCALGHHILFSGFLRTYLPQVSYFTSISTYRHCGVALTFSRSVADAFPSKPEGYSTDRIREIAARYPSDKITPAQEVSQLNPNIIFIINEAFSDLHEVGDFETTENELAFFDTLTDNCVSGISYSSVLGSRTANTEYEILTGSSMAALPYGAVPFQNYIKHDLPSLVRQLTQDNYAGLFAIHPCPKKNYNRIHAYPFLGFQSFYDNQDVPLPMEKIRKYYSDESCYNNILEICRSIRSESSRPVFAYCMTMQNHSPYDVEYDNFTSSVHATGLKREYPDVDQYLSLIHTADQSLSDLISLLEDFEEPTILLFVGDHQPSLSAGFYKEIADGDESDETAALKQYRVPFRIWANYDLPEQPDVMTSMNYLQVYLAEFTGRPMTGYQKYLADLRKQVPVITGNGYIGADGHFYDQTDTASPYYDLIEEYACLQYNLLFDEDHMPEAFFEYAE